MSEVKRRSGVEERHSPGVFSDRVVREPAWDRDAGNWIHHSREQFLYFKLDGFLSFWHDEKEEKSL